MKVALFNDSFPPIIDGVANAIENYGRIITEKYGEAVVVTPKYPNVTDNYPFEVFRFSSAKFLGNMPYRVGNPFSPKTLLDLSKKEFDIFHVHCPFASAVLARELILGKENHPPVVYTYHTKYDVDLDKYVPNKHLNKISRKFVLSNINYADEVWAVSKGATQSLRDLGYQGEILVMPNGTDFKKGKADPNEIAELERMYLIDKQVPMFLFCGRMMWYKNIKIILDALKKLSKAGIAYRAFFVGDGVDRPAIEQYTRELGIYKNTVFTGAVYDRDRLRAFFTRADLFMFPSTYDTSGLVVKEAAACYTPSILIKDSCAAEGVEDGFSGVLCEENADNFAKNLAELCKNPSAFETLGNNAAEHVYYSWEDSVATAVKRYETVLENHLRKK
ncbi:MAG: glycosyltransferase [Clostridia bacterium]|nr:glycosyltransferase [Clostridia bacterium]